MVNYYSHCIFPEIQNASKINALKAVWAIKKRPRIGSPRLLILGSWSSLDLREREGDFYGRGCKKSKRKAPIQ